MGRFPHGGSVLSSTHQPERLVCSAAGAGGRWELRLGLRCYPGGSPGKSLQLTRRQETFSCLFVSQHTRRGYSERRLNEFQRRARTSAISADPTATGAQRDKRRDSRTEARCRAALTSPRGLSAQPLGQAGAGSWGSGFGASWEGVREKVCSC